MQSDNILQERIDRFLAAVRSEKPDRIPVLLQAETFQIAYGGYTAEACINDLDTEIKCCSKTFEDIYCDGATMFGFMRPEKMYQVIGEGTYFVSEDGTTMQHREKAPMKFEDYQKLIEDPKSYIINDYFSQRYSIFDCGYEEKKQKLTQVVAVFLEGMQGIARKGEYMRNVMHIPLLYGANSIAPLDIIFDFLRGFKNTLTDIRRKPQVVKEATEALYLVCDAMANPPGVPASEFPFMFNPLHIPTFLSPRQFGDLYWPTYSKIIAKYFERGGKIHIFLEGNWEHFYDFLDEIPSGCCQGSLEADDPVEFKRRFSSKIALSGGMPLSILKYGTKEDNIDRAKWCIDNLAYNGGYVFSTDKALLSKDDVNVQNLIAVNEYMRDNGKY